MDRLRQEPMIAAKSPDAVSDSGQLIKTYTDQDRARCLADHVSGLNSEQIERVRGIPSRTVRRWIATYGPASSAEARANYERISVRAQAILLQYLDTLEDAPADTILKHGIALNAIAGTAFDKVHSEAPPASNPTLVIVIPGIDETRTIDVESRPVPREPSP